MTTRVKDDIWRRWLLHTRSGGDQEVRARILKNLEPVRDRVISGAKLQPGDTFLDVGCGDGLIAFGVLEQHPGVQVILSDISGPLLKTCREMAHEAGVLDRCRFVRASADSLLGVADAAVDAVALRSVLIYVKDKASAFREFHRVLKPGGRLSLFEPINQLAPSRESAFWGYDVSTIAAVVAKVSAIYEQLQPPDDPMLDFQARDLADRAEEAGFDQIELNTRYGFTRSMPVGHRTSWAQFLARSGNPRIPPLGHALQEALTAEEPEVFEACIRPQVEAGRGRFRSSEAFLTASRPSEQETGNVS
jgi:arsenite methyltransferase